MARVRDRYRAIIVALGGTPVGATNGALLSEIETAVADGSDTPTEVPDAYVVSFDLGAGTGTVAPMACVEGVEYALPDGTGITVPDTKTFKGWSATDGGSAISGKYTATQAATLYAVYE